MSESRTIARKRTGMAAFLAAAAIVGGGAFIALAAGCPEGACFLKICNGPNCSCAISSCADGAGFDTAQNRCRCLRGYYDVAGQCLDQVHANAYCGKGYAYQNGGCAKLTCRPGDSLDVTTGMCIPKEQVAANAGTSVGQNQQLGCPAGYALVVDNGKPACVPSSSVCAKDEVWNGQACQKTMTCATGSTWDAARGQCVAYSQGGSDGVNVDVNTWIQTTYGPNGGAGTASFCSTFAGKPWSFGISEGQSAVIRVQVNAQFPDQDVAKGTLTTQGFYEFNGGPVPPKGAADIQEGAQSSFLALTAGGGRANQTAAMTTVKCVVANGAQAAVVPASAAC
ncbi:MAG: hypothetical protein U0414_15610 [Polyangiaceae bacterium]